MTEYILSIDPGLSTGIALISHEPNERPQLDAGWQFGGGLMGLLNWLSRYPTREEVGEPQQVTVIAEKFNARNTRGFSYTTASLEPLRCEGALIAKQLMPDYSDKEPRWRAPALQYLVGGEDLADKKKRQHRFLKESGFYRTGKDLNAPNADDFRSAAAHALAYLAREVKHKPTWDLISNWSLVD